jgi:hypothetical protein
MQRVTLLIFITLVISNIVAQNKQEIKFDDFKLGSESSLINTDNNSAQPSQDSLSYFFDSHLLWGVEILDPFQPREKIITATRLWKTDLRFGLNYNYSNAISALISVRDNDSPYTNSVNLYEAQVKINKNWGELWFGQSRLQYGNESQYLNEAFDRSFWDNGLIADFLLRGAGVKINHGKNDLEFIIGADKYSYAIGMASYTINIIEKIKGRLFGAYIARDEKFSGYGYYTGIEFKESLENFWGYQVFSYKELDQEPSPLKEITYFFEGRYTLTGNLTVGAAHLNINTIDQFNTITESRTSASLYCKITNLFSPSLAAEFIQMNNYNELQIGLSSYLKFDEKIMVVPRIRYIITKKGPNIAFAGIECSFKI